MNDQTTFAKMYGESDDPWGFRTRWYECRKREITLACLPRARFHTAWEMGCSNGELSAALAARVDSLLSTEGDARAVQAARHRLADWPHVRVEEQWHPRAWPAESFELIVLSELGYYFDRETLRDMAQRIRTSLAPGGVVLACHWRHPIDGCSLHGDDVHRLLAAHLDLPELVEHREADFILHVWSEDERSVAQKEGLA